MKIFICPRVIAFLMYLLLVENTAVAQDVAAGGSENTTAILDTSIPFAIGAREGDQTIRSSFGWPTFQEGVVEGVYFRFDPDGYARFSSSPRLDENIFEVTCQNGTTICVAKKDVMEIGLTAQGKPQIQITGITPQDTFFITDHKNELPLPNTVLGPMDQRLEALLSSGGDLIIRRELETLQTLSLSGFAATVTYLRWVAQNQASFVFPRGWPVPSQQTRQKNTGLTLPPGWNTTSITNQSLPARWNLQNRQAGVRPNFQFNNRPSSGLNTQVGGVPSFPNVTLRNDIASIGFAEQAQGRSLPADINRFATLSPQGVSVQSNGQLAHNNSIDLNTSKIEEELFRVNQILRNLEVKIDNLSTRLSYNLQPAKQNITEQNTLLPTIYKGVDQSLRDASLPPVDSSGRLSAEEKLRLLVIDTLRQQSQEPQGQISNLMTELPPSGGEIAVNKNIVERLLEELNGPSKTEKQSPSATAPTGEFISLSDYINKVISKEKKN